MHTGSPGTGPRLRPVRRRDALHRFLYLIEHPGPHGDRLGHTVEIDTGRDDGRAVLYVDGLEQATTDMPGSFPVLGGEIEVSVGLHGVRRVHLVGDDGGERRLDPQRSWSSRTLPNRTQAPVRSASAQRRRASTRSAGRSALAARRAPPTANRRNYEYESIIANWSRNDRLAKAAIDALDELERVVRFAIRPNPGLPMPPGRAQERRDVTMAILARNPDAAREAMALRAASARREMLAALTNSVAVTSAPIALPS